MHQFRTLFHDGEIGGERGVEDPIEAHPAKGGNHLAVKVGAGLETEFLGDRDGHRWGMLDHYHPLGVGQGLEHLVNVLVFGECGGRADQDALTATDAAGDVQALVEGRPDIGLGPAIDEIDGGDTLDFLAHADALATEDALIRIPDDGGT